MAGAHQANFIDPADHGRALGKQRPLRGASSATRWRPCQPVPLRHSSERDMQRRPQKLLDSAQRRLAYRGSVALAGVFGSLRLGPLGRTAALNTERSMGHVRWQRGVSSPLRGCRDASRGDRRTSALRFYAARVIFDRVQRDLLVGLFCFAPSADILLAPAFM